MSDNVELISRRIVLIRISLGKIIFGISDKSPLKNINVFIKKVSKSLWLPMIKDCRDDIKIGKFSGQVVRLENTSVDEGIDNVEESRWAIGGEVE